MNIATPCRTLRLAAAALLLAAGCAGPAAAKGGAATSATVAGEILVKLSSTSALQPLQARYGLTLTGQFGARPIYRLRVVGGARVDAVVAALALEPTVLIAEPNAVHGSPEARRNVPWVVGEASAYTAQWAPDALRLAKAQGLSTGAGVRVAVLDTGVDATHPALAGRLLPGFDFVDFDADPSEAGSAGVDAGYGHGTHVAGLVALTAPGASIMPLRVLDAGGFGNAWVLAEAMLHAVDPDRNPATDDGARVLNLSLGSSARTRILDTVAQLATCSVPDAVDPVTDIRDAGYDDDRARCSLLGGALIVAAAGNDGSPSVREFPAAESAYGLLAVTATSPGGALATFANSGSWVHVAAPGDGLTSSIPGGQWASWSGTSMAAPLASGVAALVIAREPGITAVDLVRRLSRTGATLCGGTRLLQLDALSAVTNTAAPSACR